MAVNASILIAINKAVVNTPKPSGIIVKEKVHHIKAPNAVIKLP